MLIENPDCSKCARKDYCSFFNHNQKLYCNDYVEVIKVIKINKNAK